MSGVLWHPEEVFVGSVSYHFYVDSVAGTRVIKLAQRVSLSAEPSCRPSTLFFERGSAIEPGTQGVSWIASPKAPPVPARPAPDCRSTLCLAFYIDSVDWDSGPHVCTARALSSNKPPWAPEHSFENSIEPRVGTLGDRGSRIGGSRAASAT